MGTEQETTSISKLDMVKIITATLAVVCPVVRYRTDPLQMANAAITDMRGQGKYILSILDTYVPDLVTEMKELKGIYD